MIISTMKSHVIAVAHFFLMAALIMMGSSASGAHFNPNITFYTFVIGHTTFIRLCGYTIFQVIGAILGATLMRVSLGWDDVGSMAECTMASPSKPGEAIIGNMMLFGFILAAISGIAFDPLQGKTFGPIMAPVAIAAAVALVIFVGISNMRPGFPLMLNWAECVGIKVAADQKEEGIYVAFFGPLLACFLTGVSYMIAPMPSHKETGGKYRYPLLAPLYAAVPQDGVEYHKKTDDTSHA